MKDILKQIANIITAGYSAVMFGCPLDGNNAFDCSNQTQGGITSRLTLYNWEDWKAGIITEDVDGTITDYVNGSGLQGWDFSPADEANLIPSSEQVVIETGADGFKHILPSSAFDVSQAGRNRVGKMMFQKIVAVVTRVDGTGLVLGQGVGMRLFEYSYIPGSSENGGVVRFSLSTPDTGAPEAKDMVEINTGDAATTETLLAGLTTPGV